MASFLLEHAHGPDECDAAFAAWQGFSSPLRHQRVHSTCLSGGHGLFWTVEAVDAEAALALLPRYVAARTRVIQVRDVVVP
ncbi:MAG TPA: hypothetical protein VF517_12520 [Thermoleophilaceae bacterium]|jgi:hypothetical protein